MSLTAAAIAQFAVSLKLSPIGHSYDPCAVEGSLQTLAKKPHLVKCCIVYAATNRNMLVMILKSQCLNDQNLALY